MANKIILKKSNVAAKVPLDTDLDFGELALNYRDGALWYKDYTGTVKNLLAAPPSGSGSGADADFLDGIDSTEFLRSNTDDQYTNGTLTFNSGTTQTFASGATVNFNNTTGTAPFTVASTTVVTNLNADLLDGLDSTYFYSPANPPPATNEQDTLQTVTERGATSNVAAISLTGGTASTSTTTGTLVITGGLGVSGAVNIGGTLTHGGLVPSVGTAIDQIATFTQSLTITTDWQDTGISGTDLATGTYIVQLYANDVSSGGTSNNEYYSGTMSWYSSTTSSSVELPTDEIQLHRAGASSDAGLYLRTVRADDAAPGPLKLQIYSNLPNASASNYVFKFRRMI